MLLRHRNTYAMFAPRTSSIRAKYSYRGANKAAAAAWPRRYCTPSSMIKKDQQHRKSSGDDKPLASEVLTCYLQQTGEPPWTSYFVRQRDVQNDQRKLSHFNWPVGASNYHVLRTGCFPYIKYHCTRRPAQDLSFDDAFFRFIKLINLGIPTLMYGLAATQLIRHSEIVKTPRGEVTIFFLLPEDKGSQY